MDDRVKSMLKIIEVDGDSFSKKAEIYFRKRPELITFVEEAYRAYRALAERYDHISGELHKANHTIATAFPDQVEFDFQDDDDTHLPKAITSIDFSKLNRLAVDISQNSLISNKKGKSFFHKPPPSKVDRGGVSEEVDRIQKEILVLQTEKEFIRSSYENAIARYQEIEDQIESLQDELDDFGESVVIEDDEARTLMATAALRSCEDTLLSLEETQRRSAEFTRIGSRRIMMAKEKLKSFREGEGETKKNFQANEDVNLDGVSEKDNHEPNQVPVQIGPDMSLVELAEKINELVNKVITLELTTSSQKAQIESLRTETDELHKQVVGLEEEKLTLIEGSGSSSNRSKQAEVESQKIQDVREHSYGAEVDISTSSDDALLDATYTSENMQFLKDDEANVAFPFPEKQTTLHMEPSISTGNETIEMPSVADETRSFQQDDSLNLLQSLLNGVDDKEKILLTEYTSILRNYKKIKERLFQVEKNNEEYVFETSGQLLELKKANEAKDEELRSMQQILSKQQRRNPSENEPEVPVDEKSATVSNGESTSHVVEKFRRDIDVLLDENLGFWLRFSTSFQQIQKFQLDFDHLQAAFKRLSDRNTEESSDSVVSSDSMPVDKQLRELKSELQVWLEQNDSLKGESKTRFISLCNIQEEISEALASGLESDSVQLSPFQAANFQGEISNMQHENNKVSDELQAGVDHVRGLRAEVDKILSEFDEKLELPSSQGSRHHNNPFRIFPSKTHIPLRNFLFGVKSKKKPSIFRCVNPAYQKQYSDLSSGFSS
ncbi:hypothetical protein KSP40_PGU001493 [Platanthera guangdongensis]|uniref:NAB domain-containing protein n=1 Tax=Platanthera guangdongensis TaxID=2320717 RepID=A0ABR2MIV2_9ASPA